MKKTSELDQIYHTLLSKINSLSDVEIQKYKGWIQTDHVWGLENKEIIN